LKKIFYISFLIFFSILTFGITISKHYSGGEFYSFAIFGEAESCCDGPCHCCNDETIVIQFSADYLFSTDNDFEGKTYITELFWETLPKPECVPVEVQDFLNDYILVGIPPPGANKLLSQNQNFRL